MKNYTVAQKDGYAVLNTTDRKEAEKRLAELLEYQKDGYYICEQGK